MNSTAFLLLALALAVAVADWIAVHAGISPLEYVCKPLTMVVLIAVALELDVSSDPVAVRSSSPSCSRSSATCS